MSSVVIFAYWWALKGRKPGDDFNTFVCVIEHRENAQWYCGTNVWEANAFIEKYGVK